MTLSFLKKLCAFPTLLPLTCVYPNVAPSKVASPRGSPKSINNTTNVKIAILPILIFCTSLGYSQSTHRPFANQTEQKQRTLPLPALNPVTSAEQMRRQQIAAEQLRRQKIVDDIRRQNQAEEQMRRIRETIDARNQAQQSQNDGRDQRGPNWNQNHQAAAQWLTESSYPLRITGKKMQSQQVASSWIFTVKNISNQQITVTVWTEAEYRSGRTGRRYPLSPQETIPADATFQYLQKSAGFAFKLQ